MKATKFITALAALGLIVGTTGITSAKPGNSNHGQSVSAVARSKNSSGSNHGQTVSAVARSKNKGNVRDDNRWDDRNDRYRNTTRQQRINDALRERNSDIRAAQRRYAERRRDILDDGSRNNRLTNRQREQLRVALRDRDREIREAQEEYRQTVRRYS